MAQAELRNSEQEVHVFRWRLAIAGLAVLIGFGVVVGRLALLQVTRHEHFQTLAESNRISVLPVVPNRGLVVDRNGQVLADNDSAYTLEVVPSRIADLDATLDELATVVTITARDRKRFRKLLDESKNYDSLPIRSRLSDEEVARFAANRYRFPGVEARARLLRRYPFGESAAHLIGYIARINDRDLERIAEWERTADYKGTDYIGKIGVELSYERELHGTTGVEEVEVDAAGRVVRSLSRTPAKPGSNLRLSLDIELQQFAEESFGDARGALVALDPTTGGVLAYVSRPSFDLNLFVEGIDPQSWDALNTSPDRPLLNRPLRGAYPPGSTYKPFMALAALSLGKRTPEQAIRDPGIFVLPGGARFRDDKPGGHGIVDMYKSIVASCDTYYYQLASELDIDELAGFMQQFGFGRRTGIDIEGEHTGVLPSRAWKRKRFGSARYREEHRKWYLGDNISVGIGQGYNAFTPMQLAYATAIVANDGVAFRPHVVQSIEDPQTGESVKVAPDPTHRVGVSPEHLAFVRKALSGVPLEGTSARVFAKARYASAGKTGTAQVFSLRGGKYEAAKLDERLRDHAWYIAYAPADKPRIAMAVLVENGGFGAQAAAPIAKRLLDFFLLGERSPVPTRGEDDARTDDRSD